MDYQQWLDGAWCRHDMQWHADCKPAPPRARTQSLPPPRTQSITPKVTRPPRSDPVPDPRWTLPHELRKWQTEALAAWEQAGCRGVVEAATGTGKTMVALGAAERLYAKHGPSLYVVVVVPTQALARQWTAEFTTTLKVPNAKVGELHSGKGKLIFDKGQLVLITVINTAAKQLPKLVEGWTNVGRKVLVVIDECHRAGTEAYGSVLTTDAQHTLGLSATPERPDQGHVEIVYPGIGDPVYRYDLLRALDDGVLAPLRSINLYVDFNAGERRRWNDTGTDLHQALERLEHRHPGITSDPVRMWPRIAELERHDDADARSVVALVAKRRALISGASERTRCIAALEQWLVDTGVRAIVFHETIEAAEGIAEDLSRLDATVSLDHSQLPSDDRERALARFRRDETRILVAVRSLDEGIDVPDASVAVIASGSRSRRQRIQRLGRILRAAPDKQAFAFTILVRGTPEETLVGSADADLLGASRVMHHRWPGRSVADSAVQSSSYTPAAEPQASGDSLTSDVFAPVTAVASLAPASSSAPLGGYSTLATDFSANAWHPLTEVRVASGMPPEDFDRLHRSIRTAYYASLDERRRDDPTIIYGMEVNAVRRRWATQRKH